LRVWGRIEVCTGCWWESLRERGHWGDQDVDGPEGKRPLGRPRRRWEDIIKMDFRKLEGVVETG
jgi:hypothetical protein